MHTNPLLEIAFLTQIDLPSLRVFFCFLFVFNRPGFQPCSRSTRGGGGGGGVVKWAKTVDFALSPQEHRDPDTKIVLVVQDGNKPATVFGTLSIPTKSQVRQSKPVCRWYVLRDKKVTLYSP